MSQEPVTPVDDGAIISALQNEATQLIAMRQAGLATADRVWLLVVTLAAAVIAYAPESPYLFLPVPIALCLLLAYQIQVYSDVKVMGLYRGYLEQVINRLLGNNFLAYENGPAQLRSSRYTRSVADAGIYYLVVSLISAVAGVVVFVPTYASKSGRLGWIALTGYALLTLWAFYLLCRCYRDDREVRGRALVALQRYVEKGDSLLVYKGKPPTVLSSESGLQEHEKAIQWYMNLLNRGASPH